MALTNKGNFKINDTEFAAQDIKVDYDSLISDDSGKTDDGVMHIYWVFRKTREVTISLPPSTGAEVSNLLSKVQGQIYNLTYFDPLENEERTLQCFTTKSSVSMYSGVLLNGMWNGVQIKATEVGGDN